MDAFALPELLKRLDTSEPAFEHFFSTARLSLTVASWPASSTDDQQPHAEDEVYFIAEGTGRLCVADEDRAVDPGSVIYVAAGVEHHFHSITQHLQVLVFWSPPRAVPLE
ncbi:MAG: cupin domain-containing protein [Nocardioidaceae bacterium]